MRVRTTLAERLVRNHFEVVSTPVGHKSLISFSLSSNTYRNLRNGLVHGYQNDRQPSGIIEKLQRNLSPPP